MLTYILRRILSSIPVLFGILVVTFILARALGDPCRAMLGEKATPAVCAEFNHRYGFDQPILTQFVTYMGQIVRGDFGVSLRYGRPVTEMMIERLPTTLELAFAAMFFAVLLGIPLGIISAVRQNSSVDIGTMLVANIGGGLLTYSVEISESLIQYPLDPVSWLSVSPDSGSLDFGEQDSLDLIFNTAGMTEGVYNCFIIVSDNTGNQSEIPVTLTVDTGIGLDERDPSQGSGPVSVFPNPFTHETTISFIIYDKCAVSLDIFNLKGEKIKTLIQDIIMDKGTQNVVWDGTNVNQNIENGGVYFYRLITDKQYTGRIVLVR